jgi:hypothetical protein
MENLARFAFTLEGGLPSSNNPLVSEFSEFPRLAVSADQDVRIKKRVTVTITPFQI